MKAIGIVSFVAALLGFAAAPDASAFASACDHLSLARIRMPPGRACWTYHGAATTFVGDFSHGQRISAEMTGEAAEIDPRSGQVTTLRRPRDPNVEGPGGYFFGDAQAPGAMTFVAPANGTYRFSFSPCAMWGAPGAVTICAK